MNIERVRRFSRTKLHTIIMAIERIPLMEKQY